MPKEDHATATKGEKKELRRVFDYIANYYQRTTIDATLAERKSVLEELTSGSDEYKKVAGEVQDLARQRDSVSETPGLNLKAKRNSQDKSAPIVIERKVHAADLNEM